MFKKLSRSLCFRDTDRILRSYIANGFSFGLITTKGGVLFENQYKMIRTILVRLLKGRFGIFNIKIVNRCLPFTKRSIGIRMGKGKGDIYRLGAGIGTGQCIVSLRSRNVFSSLNALRQVQKQLPVNTIIVSKIPVKVGLFNKFN